MDVFLPVGLLLTWAAMVLGGWLGWQMLRQNGRLLLRLEDLEARVASLELSEETPSPGEPLRKKESQPPAVEANVPPPPASNGEKETLENRFSRHSVTRSKLKRDGLRAGTPAPDFRRPRLDGRGDRSLSDLRGKQVLLVFSSPDCGPCLSLAPHLERFHRSHSHVEVLMISRGEPAENRVKVKQHKLTFPVLLQQHWEISRRYAMFATPVAYWIDEQGTITRDVAVGTDAILALLADLTGMAARAG